MSMMDPASGAGLGIGGPPPGPPMMGPMGPMGAPADPMLGGAPPMGGGGIPGFPSTDPAIMAGLIGQDAQQLQAMQMQAMMQALEMASGGAPNPEAAAAAVEPGLPEGPPLDPTMAAGPGAPPEEPLPY